MAEKQTINVDQIVEGNATITKGVEALVKQTHAQKSVNRILADKNAATLLGRTMSAFVHIDMKFESGMKAMGEVLFNLLGMPEEVQRKAIAAICAAQNIPTIEETGRKGFAMALYARFPEMLKTVKSGKDTYAGQRLTSYVAAYKASLPSRRAAGQVTDGKAKDGATSDGKPRSARDLFQRLYLVGTTKDQATLVRLAQRARIDYDEWLPEEETSEA